MRLVLLSILCTIACSDVSISPSDAGLVADGAGSEVESVDAANAGCESRGLPEEIVIAHAGQERRARLSGPRGPIDTPLPVVLNFHGYTHTAADQARYSEMDEHAAANGYIAVYPEGLGRSWDGGGVCCGSAAAQNADDVGFVSALLDALEGEVCMDPRRVFATGYSNGGFLVHRLACELSDRLAGAAAVAGVIGVDVCEPSRSIPFLQIHGTADLVVPYSGNILVGYPSVATTMADWRDRQDCSEGTATTYERGDATCIRYQGCSSGVELCTISGGGHTWPGGAVPITGGATSQDLEANDHIWSFFRELGT